MSDDPNSDEEAWFRKRSYAHFDPSMNRAAARALVCNPDRVARHSFWPFIASSIVAQRYNRPERRTITKSRPIKYAAHGDAHIFSYYAMQLGTAYERLAHQLLIGDCVLAYRKFGDNQCNIHFAKRAFDLIASRGECAALALDIEGFFDNLDHCLLLKMWCRVLDVTALPKDHFAVFKAVSRHASVERTALYRALHINSDEHRPSHRRLCSPSEFRHIVRPLISRNQLELGIAQGSPISAVLSNIYMVDVDQRMCSLAKEHNAYYMRYSDDILIVCAAKNLPFFRERLEHELTLVKLTVSHGKTTETTFKREQGGRLSSDRPLQYLGFTFDGVRILVRSNTIARFRRRMKRSVRAAFWLSRKHKSQWGPCRKLYRNLSHLGHRSFPSYVRRAFKITASEALLACPRFSYHVEC